jgi:hypothetical protein
MAELLIFTRDRDDHNPWRLGGCEVVSVCRDGHPWSAKELSGPEFRIVCMPFVSVLDAKRFAGVEVMSDPDWELRRRRQMKIDTARMSAEAASWYADDTRAQQVRFVSEDEFAGWFRVRTPLRRRDVIGAMPVQVIG